MMIQALMQKRTKNQMNTNEVFMVLDFRSLQSTILPNFYIERTRGEQEHHVSEQK